MDTASIFVGPPPPRPRHPDRCPRYRGPRQPVGRCWPCRRGGRPVVGPLSLPPPDVSGYDDLTSSTRHLFCERVREAASGRPHRRNAAHVARICRRLGRHSLGARAGRRTNTLLGARQLAERLDDRFRLLAAGPAPLTLATRRSRRRSTGATTSSPSRTHRATPPSRLPVRLQPGKPPKLWPAGSDAMDARMARGPRHRRPPRRQVAPGGLAETPAPPCVTGSWRRSARRRRKAAQRRRVDTIRDRHGASHAAEDWSCTSAVGGRCAGPQAKRTTSGPRSSGRGTE